MPARVARRRPTHAAPPPQVDPSAGTIFADRGQFAVFHEGQYTQDPTAWGRRVSDNYGILLENCFRNASECSWFPKPSRTLQSCTENVTNTTCVLTARHARARARAGGGGGASWGFRGAGARAEARAGSPRPGTLT